MAKAIAHALSLRIADPIDLARPFAVIGCALALILAGPALPSLL